MTDDYELGASEERTRIAWWLRAAVDGPGCVGTDPTYLQALADTADAIEQHPERFAEAPPLRRSVAARVSPIDSPASAGSASSTA